MQLSQYQYYNGRPMKIFTECFIEVATRNSGREQSTYSTIRIIEGRRKREPIILFDTDVF